MRIESIHLRGVGPFDDATIEFPEGSDPAQADVYLLTGPNGSGKSTVLYMLAEVLGGWVGIMDSGLGRRRLRGPQSTAVVHLDDSTGAVAWIGNPAQPLLGEFVDGESHLHLAATHDHVGYFRTDTGSGNALGSYVSAANTFQPTAPAEARPRFSWAAFAYAGARSVAEVSVAAIREPTSNPFHNSLSFSATPDANDFANWVANQEFKRLKAKDAGRTERAEALRESIAHVEAVVSDIVGSPFRFVTSDEDNNIRASFDNRVIALDLLPDGLKSIVSWVADLLMRLDRIPWVDDTPPQQRSFLLLLDEVDIHLHPAWQRKILPIVQRMFPRAQIIASTHSPFVVASAVDARIITLALHDGVASVERNEASAPGLSLTAVLKTVFAIDSEFDLATQAQLDAFYAAKADLIAGQVGAEARLDAAAADLAERGEEIGAIVALELRQLKRQLALRGAA